MTSKAVARRPSRNPSGLSKFTAKNADVVCQLVAQGGTLKEAAARLGVHQSTLPRWMRSHPEFRDALDNARQVSAVVLEDRSLQEAIRIAVPGTKQTDARNAGEMLKHVRWLCSVRDPRRFGTQRELGQRIEVIINTNLGADDGDEPRTISGTYSARIETDGEGEETAGRAPGRRPPGLARYAEGADDER